MKVSSSPGSSWSVGSEEKYHQCDSKENSEWTSWEGESPCSGIVVSVTVHQVCNDCWHDEESDTTSCITPTSSQCICTSDDGFVEELSGPDDTRNKGTSEYSDEESYCV